jgi:hypothetical protein
MKQQILNLKKKLLIAETESFDPVKMIHEKSVSYFGQKMQLIGKLTDITEQQFAEWVPNSFNSLGNGIYEYADYCNNEICMLSTAKESFFSYLESHGIYFGNPFGKIEPELSEDDLWGDMAQDSQVYAGILYKKDKWQEAEQKVWSKDSCYIFEII